MRKHSWLYWTLVVLASSGPFRLWAWTPVIEPYEQIFPALELATANLPRERTDNPFLLGDPNGLIGIRIDAQKNQQRVRVEISAPPLITRAVFEGTLKQAGKSYAIYPSIVWDYQALARVRQSRPAQVTMQVTLDGGKPESKALTARVRSINEALYWVADPNGGPALDFNWMFAAYVNEEHPLVDQLLTEALDLGIVDRFDGYQSGDETQVYLQAFALWQALQQRGLRYSSIVQGSSMRAGVLSQYVRFLDQSIRARQANCVDGTVLLASLLRRVGIEPSIVLLPGHAVLGFALDESGSAMAFLETTLLGDDQHSGTGSLAVVAASIPDLPDIMVAFSVFEAAAESAQNLVDLAGNAFQDTSQSEYRIIDVRAARQAGIMPIAPVR